MLIDHRWQSIESAPHDCDLEIAVIESASLMHSCFHAGVQWRGGRKPIHGQWSAIPPAGIW